MDDFARIAAALHQRICARLAVSVDRSVHLLEALVQQADGYHWPGNVRQLENLLERCIVLGDQTHSKQDAAVDVLHRLMPELLSGPGVPSPDASAHAPQQAQAQAAAVLAACKGDRAAAARQLGISRTTLWRKLKKV
jgi:propionate catabolism operon transcriptional regulator